MPITGATIYNQTLSKLSAAIAGPKERAGFIEAPVTGPATRAARVTTPPTTAPAIIFFSCWSPPTFKTTDIRAKDITISTKNASNKSMFGSSITSVLWDLGDGNTSTVDNNYLHDYNSAGTYDVSLTINYNEETQVSSDDLSSLDLASATSYDSTITQIIVQGTQAELNLSLIHI